MLNIKNILLLLGFYISRPILSIYLKNMFLVLSCNVGPWIFFLTLPKCLRFSLRQISRLPAVVQRSCVGFIAHQIDARLIYWPTCTSNWHILPLKHLPLRKDLRMCEKWDFYISKVNLKQWGLYLEMKHVADTILLIFLQVKKTVLNFIGTAICLCPLEEPKYSKNYHGVLPVNLELLDVK